MKKTSQAISHLKAGAVRIARLHFVLLALFAAQTIIFHATKVATPEVIYKRWVAFSAVLVVAAAVWYLAKNRVSTTRHFSAVLWVLIATDVIFAAYNVYLTRGYASKAVFLFIIPLLVAAQLATRSALYTTALISVAAYTLACNRYFYTNFNEGYLSELYGEIAFYGGLLLVIAGLLWTLVRKYK